MVNEAPRGTSPDAPGRRCAAADRVAAIQDQVRDPPRMPHRIADRRGRALADAEQRERPVDAGRIDHRLQVLHPALQRQVAGIPVLHPAAALVKADVAVVLAQEAHPVGPDRALAVVLQVGQPGCRLDQRRPAAGFRPGQLDVVGGFDVVDLLLHWVQP